MDSPTLEKLIQGLQEGRMGAAARLISVLEQGDENATDRIMETIYPKTGHGWVVGFTGPPGAGKSSLINKIIAQARQDGQTVGAILVDPSSPLSGGAVLGDRIRMSLFSSDRDVFMRSMGSRGNLGGLSVATLGAVRVLDRMGKDLILVETVGTGQIDINICDIADTVCLVLMPGAGDIIQSLKAGIREVNDIFVVNKCDQPGAEEAALNIQQVLEMVGKRRGFDFPWEVPVFRTNSLLGDGIPELWQAMKEHRVRSMHSEYRRQKKIAQAKKEVIVIILRKLEKFFRRKVDENLSVNTVIKEIVDKSKSPQRASEEVFSKVADSAWTLTQLSEGRKQVAAGKGNPK